MNEFIAALLDRARTTLPQVGAELSNLLPFSPYHAVQADKQPLDYAKALVPNQVYQILGLVNKDAETVAAANRAMFNEALGTTEPKDWGETAARVSSALLVPMKVPMVSVPANAPRAAKVGAFAANAAIASALPFGQGRTSAERIAEVAIPTLLHEGIVGVTGTPPDPKLGYSGLFRDIAPKSPDDPLPSLMGETVSEADPLQALIGSQKEVDFGDGVVLTQPMFAKGPPAIRPPEGMTEDDGYQRAVASPDRTTPPLPYYESSEQIPVLENKSDDNAWWTAATIAATAGLATAALFARGKTREQLLNKETWMGIRRAITGQVRDEPSGAVVGQLKGATVDRYAPVVETVRKNYGEAGANILDAQLSQRVNPMSLGPVIRYAMDTGELPNSTIRIPRITELLSSMGKLDAQRFRALQESLAVGSYIDDMDAAKQAFIIRPDGSRLFRIHQNPAVSAEHIYRAIDNDPVLVEMRNDVYKVFDGLRHYAREQGLISHSEFVNWGRKHKHFSPRRVSEVSDDMGPLRRLWSDVKHDTSVKGVTKAVRGYVSRSSVDREMPPGSFSGTSEATTSLMPRDRFEHIAPGTIHDTASMLEPYVTGFIRLAEQNNARKLALGLLRYAPETRGLVKHASPGSRNVIATYHNGNVKYDSVLDDSLYNPLMFRPAHTPRVFGAARHLIQEFLTGVFAPWFVKRAWLYDMQSLVGMGRDAAGRKVNWRTMFAPVTGGLNIMRDDFAKATANSIRASLKAKQGMEYRVLTRLFNEQQLDGFADRMYKAYLNSTKAFMDKFGANTATWNEASMKERISHLSNAVAPNLLGRTAGKLGRVTWHGYTNALHDMHLAFRYMHAKDVLPKDWRTALSDMESLSLARDLKGLTGDLSRSGDNKAFRALVTARIPYSNTMVQILARHYNAVKKNPVRYALGVATVANSLGAYIVAQSAFNEDFRRVYWNESTPEQRMNSIPLMWGGKLLDTFPTEQTFRPILSPYVEAIGTIFGFKDEVPGVLDAERKSLRERVGDLFVDDDIWRGAWSGIKSAAWPGIMDPVTSAALTAGGVDPGSFEAALGLSPTLDPREEASSLRKERFSPEGEGRTTTSVLSAEVEGILDELLGGAMQPVIVGMNGMNAVLKDDGSFKDATKAFTRQFGAAMAEKMPGGYGIWGLEKRVSTRDTNMARVQESMKSIETASTALTRGDKDAAGEHVFPSVPPDSPLGTILGQSWAALPEMVTQYRTTMAELMRERDSLASSSYYAMDPVKARERTNDINNAIRNLNATMAMRLDSMEDELTAQLRERYGYKGRFTFRDFKVSNFDEKSGAIK